MKHLMFLVFISSLLGADTVRGCTTFLMQNGGRIYFGSNLDWDWESGLVIVNQRGVKKTSLVQPGNPAAQWTSKYGSVSFNQFGQEMPYGGMNEQGLVVEDMWLDETRYSGKDSRPAINLLQWIQYQLDNCRSVEEVIATGAKVRLEAPPVDARVHYLVSDATGACATIECLDGKLVCHRGQELPLHALANDTYENSLAYARAHPDPGTNSARLKNTASQARFARAAVRAAKFRAGDPKDDVKYAFDTLDQVCQGQYTAWRIVYDVTARKIHWRTHNNPSERTIDLHDLDFSCGHPVQFADIEANPSASGAVEFKPLTPAAQREYLQAFCAQPSLKKQFGDLSLQADGLLLLLSTYACGDR